MNHHSAAPEKRELGNPRSDRTQFARVLMACMRACRIDTSASVLIVGGSLEDVRVLQSCGFNRMTLSNIQRIPSSGVPLDNGLHVELICLDAEKLELPDDSYDFVVAHEVLHHCRSPHAALGEMLRVTRRHAAIMEPNDSVIMSALIGLRVSFPYELSAVIDHNYQSAGVRDSCIPNFIYRWNRSEVLKTVSSFLPERNFTVHARPYWDLSADKKDLALRTQTKLHVFMRLLGASNFARILRFLQTVFNSLPIIRAQGNKFFCCIEKKSELKPWLIYGEEGIRFNPRFGYEKQANGEH